MPARPQQDAFSYPQSDQYNHVEIPTLGRSKNRQKPSRDRERQNSIWAVVEEEKPKKSKSKQTKSKKTENEVPQGERKTYLDNPIYENELKNWTLPRVELWCRDLNCHYNQHLWGEHYNHRHQHSGGVVLQEISDDHTNQLHDRHSTGSRLSSGYHSNINSHSHNQEILDHGDSISSPHHNNKDPHSHGSNGVTMTHTDTMASSITTHSSTKTSNTDTTILTINTNHGDESTSSTDVSSGSTFATGFESSTSAGSSSSKPVGHDIGDYKTSSRNGPNVYQTASSGYPSLPYSQGYRAPTSSASNPYCPNCSGIVPLNHLDTVPDVSRLKAEPGLFWNFNKFQHPLQRDHSFHSVGGFTLNGQYNTNVKKHTMLKFCSSHKISLVVSTFSLLVTIGLLITLFLMKKRGMMDTMDS